MTSSFQSSTSKCKDNVFGYNGNKRFKTQCVFYNSAQKFTDLLFLESRRKKCIFVVKSRRKKCIFVAKSRRKKCKYHNKYLTISNVQKEDRKYTFTLEREF